MLIRLFLARHWITLVLSFIGGILLLMPALSFASSTEFIEVAGFWTQAVAEGNLSGLSESLADVRLWLEGQGRFNNANPMSHMNWYQGMARTALGYAITDRLTVWTGYTYLPTQLYGLDYMGEQDVWPAMRYIIPASIGTITVREMLESTLRARRCTRDSQQNPDQTATPLRVRTAFGSGAVG